MSFFFIPSASAQSNECVTLEEDAEVELRLRFAEGYDNCFQINGYEGHDTLAFFLLGHEGVEQGLEVYQADTPEAGVIASFDDRTGPMNSVRSPLPEGGVMFSVKPKGDWYGDKIIDVNVLEGRDEVFVYIGVKPL
ncbi:hypothetical protein [Aliidiomarina soli]|uniref:hypothetical protein n=1 Tax=Aliidiomarina soli TaxID=1928574 RepID=UPI000F89AE12|nr:hypothetical protein [Aliidiomarina soli]